MIAEKVIPERNAREAWDYWVKVKAPDLWVRRYYKAMGRPWDNPRLSDAEKYRSRYRADPAFNIKERLRRQIKKASRRDGVSDLIRRAIKRNGNSPRAEELLGYALEELKLSIEQQFTEGMNWERFNKGEIHIDHIIPQAAFDLTDDDEWRRCWAITNLRPMWGSENTKKGAKVLHLC